MFRELFNLGSKERPSGSSSAGISEEGKNLIETLCVKKDPVTGLEKVPPDKLALAEEWIMDVAGKDLNLAGKKLTALDIEEVIQKNNMDMTPKGIAAYAKKRRQEDQNL